MRSAIGQQRQNILTIKYEFFAVFMALATEGVALAKCGKSPISSLDYVDCTILEYNNLNLYPCLHAHAKQTSRDEK